MSPGGKTPISSRKRPELPPSSPTVTIAVTLFVIFLTPFKSIESPVPPPTATIFGPRFNFLLLYNASSIVPFSLPLFKSNIDKFVFCHPLKKIKAPNAPTKTPTIPDGAFSAICLINSIVKYTGRILNTIIVPNRIRNEPTKIIANHLLTCNPGNNQPASFGMFILSLKNLIFLFYLNCFWGER